MVRRLLTIAVALLLAQFTTAWHVEDYEDITESDFGIRQWVIVVIDVFSGIRGFWLGFNRGLYKRNIDAPLDDECMDDHTLRELEDAMYIFAGDSSRGDWLDALGYIAYFIANLNTCHFREPIRELIIFCKQQYPTSIEDQNQSIINVTASKYLAMPHGGDDLNEVHQ